MTSRAKSLVLDLGSELGAIRPRDLRARGFRPEYLWQLYKAGKLQRSARGVYYMNGADLTEHHHLVEAALRVPRGVVCLLSALRFHNLTTQSPFDVWMAIDRKAHFPATKDLPLRFVRFSGEALSAGVEAHQLEGVTVNIYSPAKTVADCFKYRHKIGLDVALEALRDLLRTKRASMDEVWRYARICRVANVMRPYLEALV
jgi:predicted transcriptional regulator of viral defense system